MTSTSPLPAAASGVDAGMTQDLPPAAVREIRDRCLCLATQRAARRLAQRFDRLFAPLGITNGQFSMLVALSGEWKPRLGELATFLAMDSATMTAAARTLEKNGLIAVRPDAADARIRRPQLTDAGRRTVAKAEPLWRTEHARLDAELGGTEGATIAGLLQRLR